MLHPRVYLMSLLVLVPTRGPAAQFLSPEDNLKLPAPAEVPVPPVAPPRPEAVPATATPRGADAHFADFAAYAREKNVILTWHLTQGRTMERRVQIYRFSEEPRVIHDISRGTLIAKLSGEINLYEDLPPAQGTYYYAIFVESARGLEPASFNISRNLVGPVAFASALAPASAPLAPETRVVAQESSRRPFSSEQVDEGETSTRAQAAAEKKRYSPLDATIHSTFFRGDYDTAVRELKPFLRNASPRVRAKAMFYTGLSRYRLGQYEQALRCFEHPLTKKFYRRNAEFWINKTTENLR